MTVQGPAITEIDTTKPHPARMYDYYLGGKDHYEVDKDAAGAVISAFPGIKTCARVNRSFMHRATRYLASEAGIRQWLDVGTGIPTEPNLHQVAQSVAPDAKIVYVDNDPIVLVYAQALLEGSREGSTAYIQADAREPESILSAPELAETLDMSKPLALSLNALLHFLPDRFQPYELVRNLVDALPSGSFLALTHCTAEFNAEAWEKVVAIYNERGIPFQVRSKEEVEAFFEGLELIEPGVQAPNLWRPDADAPQYSLADVSLYAGLARKP
jgi:hypothetical protein